MSSCLSDSAIAEFIQGVATAEEAQLVEAHVADCPLCRKLVSDLAPVLLAPPSSSPSLRMALAAPARASRWRRPLALALAASLLLGGYGLYALRRSPSSLAIVERVSGSGDGVTFALAERLRVTLAGARIRVVPGDVVATAAQDLGAAADERAWRARLGVAHVGFVATETDARGQIAATLQLAGAPPITEAANDLDALADRLDARVRARLHAPALSDAARQSATRLLPSVAAETDYGEGVARARRGDAAGAIAPLTRAAAADAQSLLPTLLLAETQAALGLRQDARQTAARARSILSATRIEDDAFIARTLGLSSPAEAVSALQRQWRRSPEAFEVGVQLVDAQRRSGDVAGAAATLAAVRAAAAHAPPAAASAIALAAARVALAAGDATAARRFADGATATATAIGATSTAVAGRRLASAAALLAGEVAGARAAAADAVTRAHDRVGADDWLALGLAQAAGDAPEFAAAQLSFTHALTVAKAHEQRDRIARSLDDLATLALRQGQRAQAATWLNELVALSQRAGEPGAEAAARRLLAANAAPPTPPNAASP